MEVGPVFFKKKKKSVEQEKSADLGGSRIIKKKKKRQINRKKVYLYSVTSARIMMKIQEYFAREVTAQPAYSLSGQSFGMILSNIRAYFFEDQWVTTYLRLMRVMKCAFFFSSRRRHTRSDRDWSSDVCFFFFKQKTAYEI